MQNITRGLQQAKNVQGENFNQDHKKLGDFIWSQEKVKQLN